MCSACVIPEKVEVFLEVLGNTEIRSQTEEILRYAATQLSLSVSDMLSTQTHPCLDIGFLKVRHNETCIMCYLLVFLEKLISQNKSAT